MKYIISTLLIFFLFSCPSEPKPVVHRSEEEIIKDKYNFEYITVDGCEYLSGHWGHAGRSGYLAKVDCNCVPNKD